LVPNIKIDVIEELEVFTGPSGSATTGPQGTQGPEGNTGAISTSIW
jgi:hypothetical protein